MPSMWNVNTRKKHMGPKEPWKGEASGKIDNSTCDEDMGEKLEVHVDKPELSKQPVTSINLALAGMKKSKPEPAIDSRAMLNLESKINQL